MRIDIFGLSLAETAFVLLFGVFAALLTSEAEHTRAMSRHKSQVAELTHNLDSAEAGNVALRARMDALLPKLRSTAFPTCVAVGKAKDWLLTATVRGRDAYEIEGQVVSLANITKLYAVQLRDADESECRQRIRLYVGKGVSGEEYEYAMRRISQNFYVGYMG